MGWKRKGKDHEASFTACELGPGTSGTLRKSFNQDPRIFPGNTRLPEPALRIR